jgi:hypothetical protein
VKIKKESNFVLLKKLKTMTKSITITFNEADESLLMALFKKFKIKTQSADQSIKISSIPTDDTNRVPTKAEFLAGLQDSIDKVKAAEKGDITLPTLADFLAELEEEAVMA